MNEVDARGLSCPEPVLLTAQALKSGSGVALRVLVSEAGRMWKNMRRARAGRYL